MMQTREPHPLAGCDSLVLATGNAEKAQELKRLLAPLGISLRSLRDFPSVEPVHETGYTLAENARLKAAGYSRKLGAWVLSDDTGLEVEALGGAPGLRSARYAGESATMAENRTKLLAELKNVPDPLRSARFVCFLAMANPAGRIVAESAGTCQGSIRREPAGTGGFGYDTLFEVAGLSRTLAELSDVETDTVGHRGRAVRELLSMFDG